jgi:hypothetical protein
MKIKEEKGMKKGKKKAKGEKKTHRSMREKLALPDRVFLGAAAILGRLGGR